MNRIACALLWVMLWLPGPAAAADAARPGAARLTTFPNGLRLLVLPQPDDAVVTIDTYVSLRGGLRKPGLAHLVEHLMFRSSAGSPGGALVDSLLLNGGEFNADTSLERIHLVSRCLPTRMPRALALEAERVGRLRPEPADLEYERRRILGEHDLYRENSVRADLRMRVAALAYGEVDAKGDPLLGSPEDIRAITPQDIAAFHAEAMRPERTVVLVSGPVDEDQVVAAAAASFGALEAAPEASEPPPLPPPPPARPCRITRSDARDDLLAVGFRLPCATVQDIAMAYLAETVMERENGRPTLQFYGDEALLTVYVPADGDRFREAQTGAKRAVARFWDDVRRVVHNVEDEWHFERSRSALVQELGERAAEPRRRAGWRAQRLAADAELPEPEALAAVIDTLSHARVAAFFATTFVPERAYAAFAAGRGADDTWARRRGRHRRLRINPYVECRRDRGTLTAARILPILEEARTLPLGRTVAATLRNGIPVSVVTLPGDERVWIGGVRTFPVLFAGKEAGDAGRLSVYEWLANQGYSQAGANVEPRGDKPGAHTRLDVTPLSLAITADGPADKADAVAAAMHKRMKLADLNQYSFRAAAENSDKWAARTSGVATNQASSWRFARLFGADHPLACWLQPTGPSIQRWSVGKAEKLHGTVCATDNLTLVAVGALTADEVAQRFDGTLGRLDRPRPGAGPDLPPPTAGVAGAVFHDAQREVATVSVTCGGADPAPGEDLGPLDLDVLAQVMASRLQAAAAAAGLDSLNVQVSMQPMGPRVLPLIDVAGPAHHAPRVLELVLAELGRLQENPIDADEEARARLAQVGSLISVLGDAEETRDFLLECGLYGAIPADPLAELCTPRPALLARRAPLLFRNDCAAWTVVGNTGLKAVAACRPESEGRR